MIHERIQLKARSYTQLVVGSRIATTLFSVLTILNVELQTGTKTAMFLQDLSEFVRQLLRLLGSMRLLPIIVAELFLNATVLLYAIGPWPWPMSNSTDLYVFLALAHVALLIGYLSTAFGKSRGYYGKFSVKHLFLVSLALNLLLFIPTAILRNGGLPDIQAGLTDPGTAYAQVQAGLLQQSQVPIVEYVRIVLSPLLSLLLPCTIHYWGRLGLRVKMLATISIAGFISIFIASGTNKAIADIILVAPWLIFTGYHSGNLRLSQRYKLIILAVGVMAIAFLLYFFTIGQLTRPGSGATSHYFPGARIYADTDNFLVKYLPPGVQEGAISLSSYLNQGYYALYLSLKEPFVPMFGAGNSMFLYRNLAKITGNDLIQSLPYPVRIEKYGWNAYVNWSSIYPWIASDVSFPGTLLIMFFIGHFFAMSWIDALDGHNPFAVAIFAQFIIMIFYFSANNQALQSGESLVGFYSILFLWLLTRRSHSTSKHFAATTAS